MTGYDKFKQNKDKFKQTAVQEKKEETKIEAITESTGIQVMDEDLRKMMLADAKKEAEKVGGSLPYLKVYVANKSTAKLSDGKNPNNGWFYYTPTKEQYEEIYCHILYISRGFRMEGVTNEDGKKKYPYTHIVAGLILNDGDFSPFFLFIQGQARLAELWRFRKELKDINSTGVPSYSVVCEIKTNSVTIKDNNGKDRPALVPTFSFFKDENNNPDICRDQATYLMLRKKTEEMEKYAQEYIERKEVIINEKPETLEEKLGQAKGVVIEGDTVNVGDEPPEHVNPDDIPF